MWLISWPKTTCTTKTGDHEGGTTTTTAAAAATNCLISSSFHCTCLAKLVRKLKKRRRRIGVASRQSSFQCHYDPLSYSLNFDTSGCGNSLDDQDYFKFYAFSSRFVANPSSGTSVCPRLITTPH